MDIVLFDPIAIDGIEPVIIINFNNKTETVGNNLK